MAEMDQYEKDCFEHFMSAYKHQYDLNQYFRDGYDDDLSYYLGNRESSRYPLAYNISFNKLLPRVNQVMSRFMDQLYQPNSNDLVATRPRKRNDVDRAPRVSGLLNYQLESLNDIDGAGGSYLLNFNWMFNAVAWGKGIVKLFWRKEERIGPKRMQMPVPKYDNYGRMLGFEMLDLIVEVPQIMYDGPYAECIHPKCFVPHPHYRDIQKMPAVFVVYRRSVDYLKQMADKGIYRNIDKLGWSTSSNSATGVAGTGGDAAEAFARSIDLEGGVSYEELNSERISPDVDVVEAYGRYIWPEDDVPYEVGSGIKIKGKETETIAHIGNYKTILSIQKNPYGQRPFFDMGCYKHPELYWDLGMIRLGKDLQEQYNNLGNTRHQNAMMLVNQMLKVRQDADIDPAALVWKPFGIIPVEDMGDVEALQVNDASQTGVFREQEQFFENTLSEMTGMYPMSMGNTPERQEFVGTVYSLQKVGEARIRLLLMTMDYQGFRPFLKYMMLLNTYHLPSDFEARILDNTGEQWAPMFPGDLHPDYDFTVRYTSMEPALGKQFRAQQLIQYAQMWQQSPYLQNFQFMKAILEMMDFHDSDRYLKSPEQVAQEQQAAMQQQMQMAMMQQQMQQQAQTKMMEKQAQLEIKKDLITSLVD